MTTVCAFSQILVDSMLLCICTIIDHRRCQNLVRTKNWRIEVLQSVSVMFLPYFDVFSDL